MTYNSDQVKAIEYDTKPLLILAGAGTGKTTTIIARIIHLIKDKGILPSSILALTFTNDAAEQLRAKLINKLGPRASSINASTGVVGTTGVVLPALTAGTYRLHIRALKCATGADAAKIVVAR